ncbi:component of small subunit processosome [Scheffersomyces amazonensis]|uniref:component of small subunit processosome n=1 Tax=Scheffersomyces amazonensis TaxID=1078765 RepID=UPI00315D2310
MSSLSDQLKAINDKTASVALDRKSRSQIHSRSLIFDSKVAGTQDFDFLLQLGLEGLDELSDIDSRFSRFRGSLFSDTSVNFDRNVQTKDMLNQINKNIDAFLNLVAPYYVLNPSLKALEWLVRRFHINIHNTERFILTALPFYGDAVFVKVLNVIPKNQIPNIFSWLSGYKDLLKTPPSSSIMKAFYNDAPLFTLYSEYILEQLSNGTIFKEQLVFYLSITVQLLASLSKKIDVLNETYLPLILQVIGNLLLAKDSKYSASIRDDTRLSAYSLISILSSIMPLSLTLIQSLTESILQDIAHAWSVNTSRQTLIVLGQLWNFNQQDGYTISNTTFSKLAPTTLLTHESLIVELIADDYKLAKFLFFYFANTFANPESFRLFKLIPVAQVDYATVAKLINSNIDNEDNRRIIISIIEVAGNALTDLYSPDQLSQLEMKLMTTFGSIVDMELDVEGSEEDNADVESETDESDVLENLDSIEPTSVSFILSQNDEQFFKLVGVLLKHLRSASTKAQKSIIGSFTKRIFSSPDSAVTFLVRIALTPSIPVSVAISAIRFLKIKLKEVVTQSSSSPLDLYLLIPILLLGLNDSRTPIRQAFIALLSIVRDVTKTNHQGKKKVKSTLFLESQIYDNIEPSKRAIIPPSDAVILVDLIFENVEDTILTPTAINSLLFHHLFKSTKNNSKKFGQLIVKTFILNQWSLEFLSVSFKAHIWSIVSQENEYGTDDRFFFLDTDLSNYISKRSMIITQCREAKIDFFSVEKSIVGLVGGISSSDKNSAKEADWINQCLESDIANLQIVVNDRVLKIFKDFKSVDVKLKIFSKLLELLVNNSSIEVDPLETLQHLDIDHDLFLAGLGLVQIGTQIPEQGLAKRRRRSSNSTRQAMVKDDISNIAGVHLRKLTIVLDILENSLRRHTRTNGLGHPDLLKALFKILTDLDYLGNDGNLPVLYAQETLANCMSLVISTMKASEEEFKFDSNSIRADLIVNSIRSSQSPQVQNRLLLVIAELASLAPEIILHSVMPIFTFMGAHTVRQDDEFSSSALQQTIAKVIPALATNGTSSITNEIEFLLTSFVTAFHHIPRHRRVKLFTALSKTLQVDKSLYILLFLIGQQYANTSNKIRSTECVEFTVSFLKGFSAIEQLKALNQFTDLWKLIPTTPLDPRSDEYKQLSIRSIYGASILALNEEGLTNLSAGLLNFIESILKDEVTGYTTASLRTKIGLVLLDSQVQDSEVNQLLSEFGKVTSFIIMNLDTFNNSAVILSKLYKLLSTFMDLLPLNYFIDSIIELLDVENLTDSVSIKVARNYVILAGSKFENELGGSNDDEIIYSSVVDKLLPVLVKGIKANVDVELQQSFLNTFAIIVDKFGPQLATSKDSSVLVDALKAATSENCLLSSEVEVIISSIGVIGNIINILGVKAIAMYPKILPPALKIWESTVSSDDEESAKLLQTSILVLISCLVRKLPAFISGNLESMLIAILTSVYVDDGLRSTVLELIVGHVDLALLLKSLSNVWTNKEFYTNDNAGNLGLFLKALELTIAKIEKKSAIAQSTVFMKWFIQALEFRHYVETHDNKFDNNTIYRLEASFHSCAIAFVMKLNDKSFRPLFANLVRWAVDGEGASNDSNKLTRLVAFFKFFNKLQDQLKGIVTTYYSYLTDITSSLLEDFSNSKIQDINLRRILLVSLNLSFKFDQDDYWSQQGRFESVCLPLLSQLSNIEDSIGKYLIKTITSFVSNVASDEYNETLVHGLIKYISNETGQNTSSTKIWTIRALKSIFQKMGDQWLTYLPTLIPYIAELLEDDDEAVELEVRNGLVRVIENVLGEPLDRYLG